MADETPELKIALAFSGGGYRAAAFCLGTLTYLDHVKTNGKSLLSQAVCLSTTSGGTITGICYALGIKQNKDVPTIYKELYRALRDTNIVEKALDRLLSDEGWTKDRIKSLINGFADIYQTKLFDRATFGILMHDDPDIHLKHLSFNSTEFNNGLQFRFQWSERILEPKEGEPSRGIIGNKFYPIPEDAAKEIRMADIMAASSCFPGGFEPINFPTDFIDGRSRALATLKGTAENPYPVGLMDGGIVDNQAVEPILLAEQRMKRNAKQTGNPSNILDLIILSDVASPFMDNYVAATQHKMNWWRWFSPLGIFILNTLILAGAAFAFYKFWEKNNMGWMIGMTVVLTLTIVIFLFGRFLGSLPKKLKVPPLFLKPLGRLLRLKLQVYETLLSNRFNSGASLVSEVFLKHVRRMNYDTIYDDPRWTNRRMMNAIYELRETAKIDKKIMDGDLPPFLKPSDKLVAVSTEASAMGTTLWFTPEDIERKNMLNTLIACGQFTCCWNLLEYIYKHKKDPQNSTPAHRRILDLENELNTHWGKFQADPFWMVVAIN